jgi:hypothetical protein
VSPPASMVVGLGSMVPQKFGGGCMLCCMRREEPSGVWWRKYGERLRFGLTPWRWVRGEKGGGNFWSLCTRHSLWIFFPGVDDGGGGGTRPCIFL